MHIQELARRLEATVDPEADLEIRGVATILEAREGDLTFLSNERYEKHVAASKASAVLVRSDYAGAMGAVALRTPNPYLAFSRAIDLFYAPPAPPATVHPTAVLGDDVELGDDVAIGPYVVIGNGVRIGQGTVIHAHVVVYDGADIGPGCILHSHAVVREHVRIAGGVILQNGAVIGADGFGFAPRGDGTHEKMTQAGTVEIAEDVEVQANACVDRATVGTTTIGRGTKVDNLVQIGHGCAIGENTLVCGQSGLAGSSIVGDRVILAGQVGVAGHLRIANDIVLLAQAATARDLTTPGMYAGSPCMDAKRWRQAVALHRKLPEVAKRIKELERKVRALEDES